MCARVNLQYMQHAEGQNEKEIKIKIIRQQF